MEQTLTLDNAGAPASTPQHDVLRIEELRVLELRSLDQVSDILNRYVSLRIPRPAREDFYVALTQRRDTWFVEAGELGLIYLAGLRPYIDAQLNWVFWDERLTRDRLYAIQHVLREAFEKFALPRVSAYSIVGAIPIKRFLMEVGFTYEGTRRRGWVDEPGVAYRDMILYGMLREELADGPRKSKRG